MDWIIYVSLNYIAYKILGFENFIVIHLILYGYHNYWGGK